MHERTASSITRNSDQRPDECNAEHRARCPHDNDDCSSEQTTKDVATREREDSETLIAHDSDCDAHHSSGSEQKQAVGAVPCCVQECDEFGDAHGSENVNRMHCLDEGCTSGDTQDLRQNSMDKDNLRETSNRSFGNRDVEIAYTRDIVDGTPVENGMTADGAADSSSCVANAGETTQEQTLDTTGCATDAHT